MQPRVSMVAAMGRNREIGRGSELLWRIPADLKRFRELTMGHPMVMGRKTYDSIGKPLPGRTSIVVTRDKSWHAEGVVTANSIEDAINKAKEIDEKEVFVIGGGQIYEQALPFADCLYLTLIESDEKGDVFFPPYETGFIKKIFEERVEHEGLKYTWTTLER